LQELYEVNSSIIKEIKTNKKLEINGENINEMNEFMKDICAMSELSKMIKVG